MFFFTYFSLQLDSIILKEHKFCKMQHRFYAELINFVA